MLLAVDIGNSSVVFGVFDPNGRIVFQSRAEASVGKSADEYAVLLRSLFSFYGVDHGTVHRCILSSVVPPVTHAIACAVEKLTGIRPLEIGPGVKTGLNIKIDTQAQLGSDLVADAVAALSEFHTPVVIVNMGTATTFTVIDRQGILDGVIIAPGVRISMDALAQYGSELPDISVAPPKRLIGKNTQDSVRSGVLYGHAAMLDGMIARIADELKEQKLTAIATGGLAQTVLPYCKTEFAYRRDLTLQGLYLIAEKNKR